MAFRSFMDRLMSKADNLFLIFLHKKRPLKCKGKNEGIELRKCYKALKKLYSILIKKPFGAVLNKLLFTCFL